MRKNNYGTEIPEHEIEALARWLLPEMQKYFESEDGKREFVEWKTEQEKATQSKEKEKNGG